MHSVNFSVVRQWLDYNPDTGVFVWKKTHGFNEYRKGTPAGTLSRGNYWRIKLLGKSYMAHRLAWMFVHGEWPENQIDHVNGNKMDNRISNLREVTCSENMKNRGHLKGGRKTGLLEMQQQVTGWIENLLPIRDPFDTSIKLASELSELQHVLHTGDGSIGEEFSDCLILLLDIAYLTGINMEEEFKNKMRINRARKWRTVLGTLKHVKGE